MRGVRAVRAERLVIDARHIARIIELDAVAPVFDGALAGARRVGIGVGLIGGLDIVDAQAHRRRARFKKNAQDALRAFKNLARRFDAARPEDAHELGRTVGVLDGRLDEVRARDGERVVHDQRAADGVRVKRVRGAADRIGEHRRKAVHGDDLVVPRIGVRARDAGAGQNVVHLVGQEPHPRALHALVRVLDGAELPREHAGALRGVGQSLGHSVPALHV